EGSRGRLRAAYPDNGLDQRKRFFPTSGRLVDQREAVQRGGGLWMLFAEQPDRVLRGAPGMELAIGIPAGLAIEIGEVRVDENQAIPVGDFRSQQQRLGVLQRVPGRGEIAELE